MESYLFDMSPYPPTAKAVSKASVSDFVAKFDEYGGLLNITLAGILVNRSRQQIHALLQAGRVKYIEIESRRFVIINSLLDWKKSLEEKKENANAA